MTGHDFTADAHIQQVVARAKPLSEERMQTLALLLGPVVDAQAAADERPAAPAAERRAATRQAA